MGEKQALYTMEANSHFVSYYNMYGCSANIPFPSKEIGLVQKWLLIVFRKEWILIIESCGV